MNSATGTVLLYALLQPTEHGYSVNTLSAVKALDAAKQGLFQFSQRLRHCWQPLLIFLEAA
jgi:hypothetical protein